MIKAKRTVHSEKDSGVSSGGKFQLTAGLFTSNVTEAEKKNGDKAQGESKSLFNFSN